LVSCAAGHDDVGVRCDISTLRNSPFGQHKTLNTLYKVLQFPISLSLVVEYHTVARDVLSREVCDVPGAVVAQC
jgi:hypothetical protein